MTKAHHLDVIVPAETERAAARRVGRIAGARFVRAPAGDPSIRTIGLALAGSLERPDGAIAEWLESVSADTPVVVVWHEGGGHTGDWRVAQRAAQLSARSRKPTYVAPDAASARRLLLAQANGAEDLLIASADLVGDTLEVWSCEPKLYRIPISAFPSLLRLPKRSRGWFEVSPSGSRLHWPDGDVDLDLEAMRSAIDPRRIREQQASYFAEADRYGAAIRRLREEKGLRQTDIPGLTDRTLRRVERGLVFPRVETIKKLASAHDLTPNEYMRELTKVM